MTGSIVKFLHYKSGIPSTCIEFISFLFNEMMKVFSPLSKSPVHFCRPGRSFRTLLFHVHPFWYYLTYFLIMSAVGFLALNVSKPRTPNLTALDIFFTSVSSATVSSMSSVEMEVFSNTQLIILTILMLAGGEVFTSMVSLQLQRSKFPKPSRLSESNNKYIEWESKNFMIDASKHQSFPVSTNYVDKIELGPVCKSSKNNEKPSTDIESNIKSTNIDDILKYNSFKCLCYVVLAYLLAVHLVGSSMVAMYTSLVPTARAVLESKGLKIQTFSVFTTVSTFSNCGFVPTNENMLVFKKNSGLLLILIPQILLGNTLYPPFLRFLIWVLAKFTKRIEFNYILMNGREMGYSHLLSSFRSSLLVVTVLGFILVQFVLFCSMEWNNSDAMDGLSTYQKLVGSLFVVVNSRHTGESVFDLSIISAAVLVLFIVMMYLPPYTSFLPRKEEEEVLSASARNNNQKKTFLRCLSFSTLAYIAVFVVLICLTEREKLKEDPLNFNVLNITMEIVSAYGNVGFTSGYSCKRQINPQSSCRDSYAGFVGRWSAKGKFVLIIVMFFGRLKKFSMGGGKAWKLS